jgi:F0F1-type ATP synthase membrane subunit b/b'
VLETRDAEIADRLDEIFRSRRQVQRAPR